MSGELRVTQFLVQETVNLRGNVSSRKATDLDLCQLQGGIREESVRIGETEGAISELGLFGAYMVDSGVSIRYSTSSRQVHAILAEAAPRPEGVLEEPAHQFIQKALSDFYVDNQIGCHADAKEAPQRQQVMSELYANIQDVFNEHDAQIMSSHYMLGPPDAQVVPKTK